jgi:hypothetical protein
MLLAGCNRSSPPATSDRHLQPLSERLLGDLDAKVQRRNDRQIQRLRTASGL